MKSYAMLGSGILGICLMAAPAFGQTQKEHKAGDLPGPIDSLADLQDTGRMIFKLADENNDNQISQKEAIDAGNLLVGGFFFRADQNGDGILSQDEAKQATDSFFSTKPWLRYIVETVRTAPKPSGNAGANNPQFNAGNLATLLDSNNDKQLQATELRQAVQTTIQGLFATADTNRDGELSNTEVNAGLASISRQAGQVAFQQADSDNNGQISQAEFEKAIIEPTRLAFRVMDLDHDGQLSQKEADTARQLIMSKLRVMNVPEASNSPRNTINSTLGNQTQPAPVSAPAPPPANPSSAPRR